MSITGPFQSETDRLVAEAAQAARYKYLAEQAAKNARNPAQYDSSSGAATGAITWDSPAYWKTVNADNFEAYTQDWRRNFQDRYGVAPTRSWYEIPGARPGSSPTELVYLQLKEQANATEPYKTLNGARYYIETYGRDEFLKTAARTLASKGIVDLNQIKVGEKPIYQEVVAEPITEIQGFGENTGPVVVGYRPTNIPYSYGYEEQGYRSMTVKTGTQPALINGQTGAVIASQVSDGVYNFEFSGGGHGGVYFDLVFNDNLPSPILATRWTDTQDTDLIQALSLFAAFTGAGSALGAAILPAGANAAAATALGNLIIQTALTGDFEQALQGAAASWAGAEIGSMAGEAAAKFFDSANAGAVVQNISRAVSTAALSGGDVEAAAKAAALGSAVGLAVQQLPDFANIEDPNVKKAILSAITTGAQGGSAEEILINAATSGAMAYGLSQIEGYDEIPAKYQRVIENTLAQGIGTGDFGGAALQGLISAAKVYGSELYNRDRVTQYLKDTGQLPTGNYDQLDFDEQAAVDGIVAGYDGFMFSDSIVKNATNSYLYASPQDVSATFQKYFGDVPEGVDKNEYYSMLVDLGLADIEDGKLVAPLGDVGLTKNAVDEKYSQFDIDLNSALQFDPNLDLGVVRQVYGYNNAEDALAGYLDRVETGKVISNADDYEAAVEVLNSINKYPNGDPLEAFNEAKGDVGITPEVIEAIYPGVTYDEFIQRLDGSYASGDDVIEQFKAITGREPTFEEIATYQGKPEWATELAIQTNFDLDSVTFDGSGYDSPQKALLAAKMNGYNSVKLADGKVLILNSAVATPEQQMKSNAASTAAFKAALPTGPDKFTAASTAWVEGFNYYTFEGKVYKVPDDMGTLALEAGIDESQREYVANELDKSAVYDEPILDLSESKELGKLKDNVASAVRQYEAAAKSGDAAATKLYLDKVVEAQKAYDDKKIEIVGDNPDKPFTSQFWGEFEGVDEPIPSDGSDDFRYALTTGVANFVQFTSDFAYSMTVDRDPNSDSYGKEVFARDNDLYKWAEEVKQDAAQYQSEASKLQIARILTDTQKADGLLNKAWTFIQSSYENPLGFAVLAGTEAAEELVPTMLTGGIGILTKALAGAGAALGTSLVTNQILNVSESWGTAWAEAYETGVKNGMSEDAAYALAMQNAAGAALPTLVLGGIGDSSVIKAVFSDMGKLTARSIGSTALKSYASEWGEGTSQNIINQMVMGGKDLSQVNFDQAFTAGAIEGGIGSMVTTGAFVGASALNFDSVIGRDAAGNDLTLGNFLSGSQQIGNLSDVDFGADIGGGMSLGSVGASVLAQNPELSESWGATMPTQFNAAVDDAMVFDADEQADWLAERGLGGFGVDAYGDVIADADTELDATNALSDWADPLYMDRAEAQSYLQERGYQGTPEEVDALLRDNGEAVPESEAQSRIDQYVDEHTVTADELRDKLRAENPTITEEEIQSYTQQGANVNQDQVIADAVSSADSTYRTEQEVRDRFADLGLNQITDADAARFAGDVAEGDSFYSDTEAYLPTASQNLFMDYLNTGNLPGSMTGEEVQQIVDAAIGNMPPGLSIEEVTTAINEELSKLPASATPDDVASAVQDAQNALSEQIASVETGLQEQYDALSADQQALADNLVSQGETLQDAIDAVSVSLGEQISDVEAGLQEQYDALSESQQQLADDLVAQGETLESAISTAQTSLEEQITGVQEDLQAQYDALSESQQELADSLVSQGETLEDAIATAQSSLEEQITGVSEDLQTKYESLTQGQQDLADALVAQGETLESAIATAQSSLEEQITGVQEDVQAKYDSLTEGQQALADQLVAQGETLASAIATAQTSLETQIGDVETALNEKLDTYEQAGIDRDAALSDAIDEVAADLGTTREDILTQLGTTEENIRADMQSAYDALTQQNQELADLLGKPAQEVTQADIDAMNAILAGEQDTNLAYDANQDGVIDQSDIDILTGVLAGTNVDWQAPEESYWAPTGVYGEMAANQSALETQLAELEAQRIADLEAERARQQRIDLSRSFSQLRPAAQQAMQQSMTTTTPIYGRVSDFDISGKFDPTALGKGPFRSPSQYGTNDNKMAQGGYVGDQNLERLLEIING